MSISLSLPPPVTTEYGRHQKDEVSGYLHSEGDPDDYTQGFVQHQGPVRSESGKNQGGCWENAGKIGSFYCELHGLLVALRLNSLRNKINNDLQNILCIR